MNWAGNWSFRCAKEQETRSNLRWCWQRLQNISRITTHHVSVWAHPFGSQEIPEWPGGRHRICDSAAAGGGCSVVFWAICSHRLLSACLMKTQQSKESPFLQNCTVILKKSGLEMTSLWYFWFIQKKHCLASHANKWHILYLTVIFYSCFFLFLASVCTWSKRFHFQRCTAQTPAWLFSWTWLQLLETRKPKHQRLNCSIQGLKASLELMPDLHMREHPSTHSCVFLDHRGGHVIPSDSSTTATDTKKFSFCTESTGVTCVSLIKSSTLKHTEERGGTISTFI